MNPTNSMNPMNYAPWTTDELEELMSNVKG